MYGLVNQAIQDLITENFGADVFAKIKERAGVGISEFVAMESYDDAVTYDLVSAASDVLEKPMDQLLEIFGQYWTEFVAERGYGEFLALSGNNLEQFLMSLDDMHTRISLTFPELQPPSFSCERVDDQTLRLKYYSHREGLAPMVVGLLKGMGSVFGQSLDIVHESRRDGDRPYDGFRVRVLQSEPA
ncbi:MAG: heme NO-binding domain-containing protein [Planctomycetota bacterium]